MIKIVKKNIIFLIAFIIIISIIGCNSQNNKENKKTQSDQLVSTEQKNLEEEIQNLYEQIEERTVQINYLNNELDAYKRFITKIDFKLLDQKMLKQFAKNEWEYKLKIADIDCPVNGEIEIAKNTFDVQLIQLRAEFTAIPDDLFNKGAISEPYSKHLKVISPQQYKIDGTSGTNVDSVIYKFSGLTKGTVVELNITEELQERLGLKTRDIKIKVK